MIIYKKMSLFDAPKGSILVHAANSKGVWGSGIAKEFKIRFPKAFENYNKKCTNYPMIGEFDFHIDPDSNYAIGSLVTSKSYGSNVDSEEEILINTTIALNEFCQYMDDNAYNDIIYSNKFNSGLFKVPWEKTETILKILTNRYNITWVICDPHLIEKSK